MEQDIKFGPYEIVEKIAEGAFSEIFKVKKGREVFALKKLKPYMMYDREYIPLIKTEAMLLSRVEDRSHFPIIYDQGKIDDENFSVIEFIEGLNLEDFIRKSFSVNRPLTVPLACRIVLEICLGLEHLHQINMSENQVTVHGDLRASNVMLNKTGQVKLIDLGLKGGTFDYMPLERLHDRKITAFTDIYAAGHILYELLHGKKLFVAETKLEAYFAMRNTTITEDYFEVDSFEVRKILTKSLKQETGHHYQAVSEMRRDLEEYLKGKDVSVDRVEIGDLVRRFK